MVQAGATVPPKRVGRIDLRLQAIAYNEDFAKLSGRTRQNIMAQNLAREDSAVVPSCVFAGVGGYYASKQSGLAGVFRRAADGSESFDLTGGRPRLPRKGEHRANL